MINIENYLRINPVDMIMVLISTFLIVIIAKKFFWNILKDYLDKRQQYIKSQLEEAEKKNREGELNFENSREELAKVQRQAKEILDMAKVDADKEAEEIIISAKQRAQLLNERARVEIEQERKAAADKIKQEMSSIALAAAEEILKKDVNDEDHRRYVKEFIDEAGEGLW